jgi:predicted RNA-binding Zn-ribbon protein involved in translation (DUF1610 family)
MAKKKEEGAKEAEKAPELVIPASVKEKCISCNTSVVNDPGSVRFPCPNCGKHTIIRCSNCRKIVTKYKCPLCGFEGPN